MRVIWRIACREWLAWRRDRWRLAAALFVAAVAMLAAFTGAATAASRAAIAAASQQADYDRWLAQPKRNAHSASHFGISAFYLPSRLAAIDPGVAAYAGSALFLEAHKQNEPVFSEAIDRGAAARFGQLTLSAVLQVWLPLVIVLLGAGCLAADRDAGILAQVMATGVSPMRIAAGKALAVGGAAAAILAPALIVIGLAVLRDRGVWPVDTPWRVAALAAALAAYALFWVALTIAVSARASSERLAIAGMSIIWCVVVALVPRVASDVARLGHPLPNRAQQDRLEIDARIMGPGGVEARRNAILAEYGVTRPEDLPLDYNVIVAQRAEDAINRRLDIRNARNAEVYLAERRDYGRAAWASPAVAFDLVSAGAAGTDDVHHRIFLGQAEQYRRRMIDLLEKADERKPGERAKSADAAVWSQLPKFVPAVPPMGKTASGVGASLTLLAGWGLTASLLAAAAVRRIEARL